MTSKAKNNDKQGKEPSNNPSYQSTFVDILFGELDKDLVAEENSHFDVWLVRLKFRQPTICLRPFLCSLKPIESILSNEVFHLREGVRLVTHRF
jgi:hypothetical protein